MSQHRKPFLPSSNLWRSLDKWTWISYILIILCLTCFAIFFTISIQISNVEITEVIIRMSLGWLEPREINWSDGFMSIKVIVVMWLLLGISFNLFYNVKFRSSLIAQEFPDDIEDMDQLDILRHGLFVSSEYSCM